MSSPAQIERQAVAVEKSSGRRPVRRSGNDSELVELATGNALAIGAGHSFIVFLRGIAADAGNKWSFG
jgi:adenosine/AMP kinase